MPQREADSPCTLPRAAYTAARVGRAAAQNSLCAKSCLSAAPAARGVWPIVKEAALSTLAHAFPFSQLPPEGGEVGSWAIGRV